jgi:hypothetical protein
MSRYPLVDTFDCSHTLAVPLDILEWHFLPSDNADIILFEAIVATLLSSFPYMPLLILFIFIDDAKGQSVGYIIVYPEKPWVSCDDVYMIIPFKGDNKHLAVIELDCRERLVVFWYVILLFCERIPKCYFNCRVWCVDYKIFIVISVPSPDVRDKHVVFDDIIVEPIHDDFVDIRDTVLDYDGLLVIQDIKVEMRRFYLVYD